MLIHINNNPYRDKPYAQKWAQGWFAAKAKHEGRAPKHTPKVRKTDRPVLSDNRISKFNAKNRTQA